MDNFECPFKQDFRDFRAEASSPVVVTITITKMQLEALKRRYYETADKGTEHLCTTAIYEISSIQSTEELKKIIKY